ncbi:MAG: PEP-CTERM sorting domain-containing protein [Zoogloea sp.]|jgi:MYXO-CTERM domain-containing protein|uniref:PEP-CTERM sorting domain-containing protein n=1 Tax=Zoogloea sp. TaxID=49181 RepID=UPI0026384F66|nr:PEP-CTERM sorting domain-containing protein [Zoogloea sp.]MDD3328252.1 PEP-CTERM sorting domain-containing protein [Zoogloea sp.]
MMHAPIFKKAALALAAAGLMASVPAHADTLAMEVDINSLMGFTVDVAGSGPLAVDTGILNVSNLTTNGSFLAFCYELLQGVSVNSLAGLPFDASTVIPAAVQTLFNQSYAEVHFDNAVEVAGFQIALWETLDDNNLNTGALSNWGGATNSADEGDALFNAELFLDRVVNGGASTGNYQLTVWQSPDSQDIIQASTATIPEPTSLMLGALGLAGLSLVRRRKA